MSQAAHDQQRLREYLADHFSTALADGQRHEETPVDTVLRILENHRVGAERLRVYIDSRLACIDTGTQQTLLFEPVHDAAILLLEMLLPDEDDDGEDDEGDNPVAPKTPTPAGAAS